MHRRAHRAPDLWLSLQPGQEIEVVKLNPQGVEAARYPATVVGRGPRDGWVAFRATWAYKRIAVDGLIFDPGDELIEWFSPFHPFNAFAVLDPGSELRGWYANVTYPAYLETMADANPSLALVWHDLYLDLVGFPDQTYVVLDEDELAESGLESADPGLHRDILAASTELARRFRSQQLPFLLVNDASVAASDRRRSQNESD